MVQKLHLMTLCVHADSCCTFGAIQGDEAPHPWKTHLPKLQRMPALRSFSGWHTLQFEQFRFPRGKGFTASQHMRSLC